MFSKVTSFPHPSQFLTLHTPTSASAPTVAFLGMIPAKLCQPPHHSSGNSFSLMMPNTEKLFAHSLLLLLVFSFQLLFLCSNRHTRAMRKSMPQADIQLGVDITSIFRLLDVVQSLGLCLLESISSPGVRDSPPSLPAQRWEEKGHSLFTHLLSLSCFSQELKFHLRQFLLVS